MAVASYRELQVWQKAMDLVVDCYALTKKFPDSERYGLASQLQRAAVSIPSNIAEGQGRSGTKEFLNHLSIATGSLMEVETQIQIAARLNYSNEATTRNLLQQTTTISKMLAGLKKSLRTRLDQS